MRILVAGATGSIGIHVVNTAIAMGHQPVTLVRNRRKIKLLPRGTDIFYGDVSIPETLTDLPKDIDAIIFTLGSDGQVSVLAMSSAAVSAAEGDESVTTTVNGGVIHFKGEVVNAACAIDSESMNQTVELGQVRSSRLAKAGDLSSAVGFNIKLNDCDTNVSSNAAVAFLGTTVTSNDDTLALQSSAAGSAQNVGIQILDRTGEVLVLDGATFSAKTDLIDGTNILPFQARYIALGQSVAGTANADATFKVQYL
ncbi:TPA: type 1 fimbrial major subunit FimA [Escherichia coli]|nr:type 1 fimbrial major subunit FimA [Escherichia coli]